MTKKTNLVAVALIACAALCGCAGLMMNVKDLDENGKNVTIEKGATVAIDEAAIEESFAKTPDGKDPKVLAAQLKKELEKELTEDGVQIDPASDHKLSIEITRYERGCGFCRGFFPVFGLGNTYLNGQITLESPSGKRVLVVEKTGQSSGTAQMGDQTETNMGYFASVVASKLTDKEEESGGEAKN